MIIFGYTPTESDIFLLKIVGTLFVILIGFIGTRKSNEFIDKKREKNKTINSILTPFNDTFLNIENGELNHIHIMNSLFESQKTAIAYAKTIAGRREKEQIEKTWNDYKSFYSQNAKGQVLGMFASFPEEIMIQQNKALRDHMKKIIKEIKGI